MFDPAFVDSISKLGALGFAVMAVLGFTSGLIRVGRLVDKRETQLITERDEWRSIAETSLAQFGRLTDVLEATSKKMLP